MQYCNALHREVSLMKSHTFILVAIILLGCLFIPALCSAATVTTVTNVHPYMLFTNITQTPGYQNQASNPWKTWQSEVLGASNLYLTYNFSGNLGAYDRILYRGQFAEYLGLSYQITKNPAYAQKAKEALLNISTGSIVENADYAYALEGYSLAYDWVQPTLDPTTDGTIRDKLATLADRCYGITNVNGTQMSYVDFPDLHGHLYPALGMASAALADYTNPNNLPLKSGPSDWYHVGTDYLFVNDLLHSGNKSMFSHEYDPTGKDLLGAYKSYTIADLSEWFQVCNTSFGINLMSTYPIAEKAFTSEIWESMPNEYGNNFVTNGNTIWDYQKGTISLMTPTDRAAVLNYMNLVESKSVLPNTFSSGSVSTDLMYCVYGNYQSVTPTFPAVTSHLDPSGVLQVVRQNWGNTSDWLSFTTWNNAADSNREMMHNDQLGFEYYSRGDLLLSDAGEPKHILDQNYGTTEIDHNVISIENPRTPFPVSPWSGSSSAGFLKGSVNGLTTPASTGPLFQLPWMQLAQANVTETTVVSGSSTSAWVKLSSPVQWQRTILYPESDYFIVVDRLQGTETWGYRNIFRPSSLMVTPSTGAKDPNIGHDNVNLVIGSTPYNWQSLTYKNETNTGITTNSLSWQTTNPYGASVTAYLVTSPASQVLIEKDDGRIGGYEEPNEVYTPVVYFKAPTAQSVFRITALLANYATETPKTWNDLTVTGNGHALNIHSTSYDDYIYAGSGVSGFGNFSTDADTAFIRSTGGVMTDFTLLNGTFINAAGSPAVSVSNRVVYLTAQRSGNTLTFQVSGSGTGTIVLSGISATSVSRDGIPYSGTSWNNQNGQLSITTDLGTHQFQVSVGNSLALNAIGMVNATVGVPVSFPVNATYNGQGTLTETATNLPNGATFNAPAHQFTWTPSATQTGMSNVTFTVSDGTLTASTIATISVSAATATHQPGSIALKPVYDGDFYVNAPNSTFTGLTTQSAAYHMDHGTSAVTYLSAYPTSGNGLFQILSVTAWTFNTSQIPTGSTITGANLSLYLSMKTTQLGLPNYLITPFSPVNSRSYALSDWQRFGNMVFGSVSGPSWLSGTSTNISLSTTAINRSGGDTTLAGMLSWQQNQTFSGTWKAGSDSRFTTNTSLAAANQPTLYISYTT